MDEATQEMMTKPRCGLKDKHDFDGAYSRRERFAKLGELYRVSCYAVVFTLIRIYDMLTLETGRRLLVLKLLA
jgi:hypothetical protein